MSGKFMSVKRIVIPTITMVIIASQLMGCAAASQSELLQMINNGDSIEIEVALPAFAEQEQGEESTILWEQLALLTTNPELRKDLDDTLGITVTDTGKNGILYVNAEGNNEPNNTLYVALHNRAFSTMLEDENSMLELSAAGLNNYADIEADETNKAVYMAINGYFNLLPDATPNYSNPDTTLTRAEFMAMVMRAMTPVQDITTDSEFASAVGNNDLNLYAQEVADASYLDLESKSLNNMTYNGTITRAEAMYLLSNLIYSDAMSSVNISTASFTDAKDGGNIAEEQKFIENTTKKGYWKSYELTYALTNPDQGVPTELYKGMVVAEQKGFLTTDETRWDEGLTKSEAVEFIINALKNDPSIPEFNYKQGTVEGYEVKMEEETTENTGGSMTGDEIELTEAEKEKIEEIEETDETLNSEKIDEVEIVEVLDKDMYAVKNGNIRDKDTTAGNIVASLEYASTIHVTGKTSNGWYQIKWGDTKVYVASSLLSDTKPSQQTSETTSSSQNNNQSSNNQSSNNQNSNNQNSTTTPTTNQEIQNIINEFNGEGFTGSYGNGVKYDPNLQW